MHILLEVKIAADFSDDNLTEAFCKCNCIDFGDFTSNGLNHFDSNILVTIPSEMQDDITQKFLQCCNASREKLQLIKDHSWKKIS